MTPTAHEPLKLTEEELALLGELLESEQAKLLIGIRHAFHREYRDELRRRLDLAESLMKRMEPVA